MNYLQKFDLQAKYKMQNYDWVFREMESTFLNPGKLDPCFESVEALSRFAKDKLGLIRGVSMYYDFLSQTRRQVRQNCRF
jgi:hypothetical protein